MNERALAWLGMGNAMDHLVGRDVIQHQADGLTGIKARRNNGKFTEWQADVLGVAAMDWHGRNHLTEHRLWRILSGLLHDPYNVPSRREGKQCLLRMDSLSHQQVCKGYAGSEHAYPHLA